MRGADRRLRLILFVCVAVLAAAGGRAGYLQAFEGGRLGAEAREQQTTVIPIPSERGALLDRRGRALAAASPAVTLGAYTRLVTNPMQLARTLAPLVAVDAERLTALLSDRRHVYVELVRGLDLAARDRIQAEGIGGGALDFTDGERREYPQGVGAQLVGVVDTDGKGIAGAELSLDRYLRARAGTKEVLMDPARRVLRVLRETPPEPGRDVHLTLDRDLQAAVDRIVAETAERWGAKGATAVVLDPRDGGILAMASAPGVPEGGYRQATSEQQRLRAVTDQYEPGSTFKLITVGAALQEGAVTPQDTFTTPNCIALYDRTVCEAHDKGTLVRSVADIFADSSNVGTIMIAKDELGQDRLAAWIDRLGFGVRTGVDLPGEGSGTVRPLSEWSGTSILNIPIGEGIAVTPLQLASVYAAVANDGIWREPHIAARIGTEGLPEVKRKRVFSRAVTRQLQTMLRNAVETGTGTLAQISGYTVAGKTGTTQKIDPETGEYCGAECGYHSSFVGYVPATRPRAVILVMVDEPDPALGYYGADVAAPAFAEIGKAAVELLGLAPTRS